MDIEPNKCKTARELVEELDISQASWSNNNWSCDWIFRGQADADWPLTPAALRLEEHTSEQMRIARQLGASLNRWKNIKTIFENSHYYTAYSMENIANLTDQLFTEFYALRDFFRLGSNLNLNSALPLPSEFPNFDDPFAKHYIENLEIGDFVLSIWKQPYIAVAQHHGVATRLLDWTKNPLYAAFFACEGIQDKASHIAVYATIAPLLEHDIRLIEINKTHSPYISAQEGIFTLDTKADLEFLKTGKWRGIEDVPNLRIRKFTLPKSEVNELLRILWLKQVTRAHMMPSLDNVIIALKSMWKLQLEGHQKSLQ